jgi:hypothetical protein
MSRGLRPHSRSRIAKPDGYASPDPQIDKSFPM